MKWLQYAWKNKTKELPYHICHRHLNCLAFFPCLWPFEMIFGVFKVQLNENAPLRIQGLICTCESQQLSHVSSSVLLSEILCCSHLYGSYFTCCTRMHFRNHKVKTNQYFHKMSLWSDRNFKRCRKCLRQKNLLKDMLPYINQRKELSQMSSSKLS